MKFINLTPHAITVEGLGEIPASGTIARVSVRVIEAGDVGGIRLRKTVKGDAESIPEPAAGVTYVVSGMVLDALSGTRCDVVAPDTGADAIRNERGQIVSVLGFVC